MNPFQEDKIIMEIYQDDKTTVMHRLAVLAIGLYTHTQTHCPLKEVTGLCRDRPSDFASCLAVNF